MLDRIKKARKASRYSKNVVDVYCLVLPRRNTNETEFALYRYGPAYHPGIPDRVLTRQVAPVVKAKGEHRPGELIGYRLNHTGQMTNLKIVNTKER